MSMLVKTQIMKAELLIILVMPWKPFSQLLSLAILKPDHLLIHRNGIPTVSENIVTA